MTDPTTLTLAEVLTAFQNRSLSAVELMSATLLRIERTEPELHNWVELYPREAMTGAQVADRRRAFPTSVTPLLGVPIGVKDIFDIAGKQTRCNARLRADVPVAKQDAEAVHVLRRDGAIFLGKTVTQEYAAGVVSAPARNPWNPEHIPGGSSGGSAAAVAAGCCVGALGSDTGGSIRTPTSVTGTVGLKPTYGRLSLAGVFPLSPSLDTVGPIARTVHDATILYLSLAARAAEIATLPARLSEGGDRLTGVRIGVLGGFFTERLQPGVARAFEQTVTALRDLGAELIELEWAEARAARAVALLLSRFESTAVHRDALRDSPDLIGEDLRRRIEVGTLLRGDVYLQSRQARLAIRRSIADLYSEHKLNAVVTPTLPATAPPADDLVVRYPDGGEEAVGTALLRLTMPWNTTGQPVISVPCGFDEGEMPIGLSFVGRPDAELPLCQIAHIYEQAAGWYRHRPVL
jgi:aspartyl-tRNA(Asn)/glutamyl-tRNA(Gln) amidotransferase subunit A